MDDVHSLVMRELSRLVSIKASTTGAGREEASALFLEGLGSLFFFRAYPQMSSCQSSTTTMTTTLTMLVMVNYRSSNLPITILPGLRLNPLRRPPLGMFCRLFGSRGQLPPSLSISSSLTSILTSANVIASAAAKGSASVPGAVTSAITHVAFTAVAIASGACLSTKVDFLWPKAEEQPGSLILEGVDVTGYPIFDDAKVRKAIEFAKRAHHGQFRKTGDPYLTHCIQTGRILAMLVPCRGERAIDTVVAGILHDIIDDTSESLRSIEQEFGNDVAGLVAGVSRLSYINQLLRRHRRSIDGQGNFCEEEANNLRVMLLGMVDDPRVVLIKLSDRLHNMRTIYALPFTKAQAVAQETLVIWCSLASKLGLWALKAELEDLCFAALQPQVFQRMRHDLASMWKPSGKVGNPRRILAKAGFHCCHEKKSFSDYEESMAVDVSMKDMKNLLEAVVPFEILLDRRRRRKFITDIGENSEKLSRPNVVKDAGIALASMVTCEEALDQELILSTSYVPGMEVTLSSRLKSLYSIYSKMKRKDVGIDKVYDARALRVVVGDDNGSLHGPAVQCCYSLLNIVHRLWTPIDGEFDDYIVNPKPSGYQRSRSIETRTNLIEGPRHGNNLFAISFKGKIAYTYADSPPTLTSVGAFCTTAMLMLKKLFFESLHTAVLGPDSSPLEVQIRTQRMHDYAEHGLGAHWLYKETLNLSPSQSPERAPSEKFDDSLAAGNSLFRKYASLKVGHPVLRVEGSQLLAAIIVRVDKGSRELLVAVSSGLAASETVAERRSYFHTKQWEAYAKLYKKVSDEWWCQPGHGDWCTCLEKYTLCQDGMYHKEDQFERLLPTFIQVIELTEDEECEYWSVVSAVFEGKEADSIDSRPSLPSSFTAAETGINNKVQLLRTMLQWEEEIRHEAISSQRKYGGRAHRDPDSITPGEVVIICWPHGDIMRLRTGSTAADAARRVGLDGKLVLVNGQLVLPNTQLRDGDVVEVRL